MTRTIRLLGAVGAFLALSPASAQETGVYVGGALGQASYREACNDLNLMIGQSSAFQCTSREDTAMKGFLGWRFNAYLAAELSYIDFGVAKAQGSVSGAPVSGETNVRAWGASALGILPLGERLAAFARLGLLQTRIDRQVTGAVSAQSHQGEIELHVGIGGMVRLGRGWALRAEFERVNDSKIDLSSLGVQYQF